MTCNSQSACFISGQHCHSSLKFVFDGNLGCLDGRRVCNVLDLISPLPKQVPITYFGNYHALSQALICLNSWNTYDNLSLRHCQVDTFELLQLEQSNAPTSIFTFLTENKKLSVGVEVTNPFKRSESTGRWFLPRYEVYF